MNYQKQYENKINWQNKPSTNTPINATNLNKMDNALNYIDEKLSEAINGGIVEANPSGSATSSLNKIGINGTVYGISGGGGSYNAGSGISISNSVITNIRKGALTGVVDSISGNIAHTQITGARDTFAAGALILLQSEAAGTANNLRIQYGAQSRDSQTFAIYDTSSTAASITIASGDTVIMMIDNTGYKAIILNVLSASGGSSYAGLGIGKKTSVTNNVIDTDIDLHRAPMAGDRLLIWFNTTVQNPTGLTTYNNGTAVTSNLENVTPLYYNAGWNLVEYMNDGLLYNNVWVRKQNVPIPNNTLSGLSDTAISVNPTDGQVLTYNSTTGRWENKAQSGGVAESVVGTVENGTTASQAYAVGEHFIRNDKFCTAIAAIASGATLTLNTNYVEGTIAENLSRATTYSSSETEIGTWNGQKLYRKIIDCGGVIQGTKYVSSGVSGAITVRHAFATAYSSSYQMPLPFLADGYEWSIGFGFVSSTDAEHPNSIRLTCRSDQSSFSSVIAVIEYTKNS